MDALRRESFPDRARASFLGLALGDAYGAPLEFINDESVRDQPVEITAGRFMWTDDTHMSIYLAKAILDLPAHGLTSDAFGTAVAKRFVEWSHDSLTLSTAPGGTCLRGVGRYEQFGDWRTSGVAESDGCGAVMRICPLAMAFEGDALTEAARISAIVTHGHPNAIDAAVAASHMLRDALETGVFDPGTVDRAIGIISRRKGHGTVVIEGLRAAIEVARSDEKWLDEEGIPDGGGGWRCASALGLATAAALRWQGSFERVVDRAARIFGDSDSVACMAGMFSGATHGTAVLPKPWLKILPRREEIESLADQLSQHPTTASLD
jgi:ADP-ribosylglycohydrolase